MISAPHMIFTLTRHNATDYCYPLPLLPPFPLPWRRVVTISCHSGHFKLNRLFLPSLFSRLVFFYIPYYTFALNGMYVYYSSRYDRLIDYII